MHILVVEDEVALCDTIVRSLKRLAYSVDYCYDGQKALDMLSVESFDLVVLDLNLPNIDGMTVLKTLRQTDIDTKVLILSARCEVADKVLGLDEGANDYLTKPYPFRYRLKSTSFSCTLTFYSEFRKRTIMRFEPKPVYRIIDKSIYFLLFLSVTT